MNLWCSSCQSSFFGDTAPSEPGQLVEPLGLSEGSLRDLNLELCACRDLGICINLDKSELSPFQTPQYLGIVLDSKILWVFPAED